MRPAGRDDVGDIGCEVNWDSVVQSATAVVHLAAHVHKIRSGSQGTSDDETARYRAVNTIASERLARAAVKAGVRRFIFLSTAKVMGEMSNYPLTADDPVDPQDPYAQSKWEAEQAITAAAGTMEVVVLRPPLVYGPNVKGNFLRLMRTIDAGLPLPLGSIKNRRSLLFVGNLCEAILGALKAPPGVYLPTDGKDLSTADLIRHLAKAMDRPARLISISPILVKICALIAGRHGEFKKVAGSLQLDGNLPGWQPSTSVEDGLRTTARWFAGVDKKTSLENAD